MSDDMSDIMNKLNSMLKNNELPDDIKNIVNNFSSSGKSDSGTSSSNNNTSSDTSGIDFDTILKMKTIMDSMNNPQNDPRSNLLKSLKPYLRDSRKSKVDQYIKIFSMGKVFEAFNPLGGDKKNNV